MNYQELIPQRLDIFAFIIFLGIVQGFFFSIFLLKKSNRLNPKNTFLGLFLLINAVVLLEVFLCYSGLIVHTLWLVDYSEPTNFLSGPILYFLILSFIGRELPKRKILHYLPFVFYTLYMVFFFVQGQDYKFNAYVDAYYPAMEKLDYQEIIDPDPLGIKAYINPISVIYTLIYILFSLKAIVDAVKTGGLKLFKGATKDIRWLTYFLLLGLVNFTFWFVKSFTGLRDVQDHMSAVLETVIIYFVGYKILSDRLSGVKNGSKYARSSLTQERKDQIGGRLETLMNQEQVFLDSELSLAALSQKVGTSNHHVSQYLNEIIGKSFQDYINELRIDEAKKILLEQEHLKIEEVAEMAGFNSKSTFNTAFKKVSGQTPSEFRDTRQ